jgi:putative endonuclease
MFYIYILKCRDNSLYTGFAVDIEKRLETHRKGLGSKYVRSRLPFELIYSEKFETKSEALKREIEIKSWSREQKINFLKLSSML